MNESLQFPGKKASFFGSKEKTQLIISALFEFVNTFDVPSVPKINPRPKSVLYRRENMYIVVRTTTDVISILFDLLSSNYYVVYKHHVKLKLR